MGNSLSCNGCNGQKVRNTPVSGAKTYAKSRSIQVLGGATTKVLICALDYKQTENPLTCTIDAQNLMSLCDACGITDVTYMKDEQCQVDEVKAAIDRVARSCGPDDTFVFYYTGHGTNVADESGDEEDGEDEAFCFVDGNGQVAYETLMTDDTFAELVLAGCQHESTRILVITDCCHSGSICDLEKDGWDGRTAMSIAGCLDNQTSGDIGRGGIMTHSMLLAIEKLSKAGETDYSVGQLYNETLRKDRDVFNSAQDITFHCSPNILPSDMPWPFVPQSTYNSPLHQSNAQATGGGMGSVSELDPDSLAQFGISAALMGFVHDQALGDDWDEDEPGGCGQQ